MDGIRKSILFLEVAGIMLHIGLFSELVVEDSFWPFLLDVPTLVLAF